MTLNAQGGASATGSTGMDMLLLRALLARANGGVGGTNGGSQLGGAGEGDSDPRLRALAASITELRSSIEAEIQQARNDAFMSIQAIKKIDGDLKELRGKVSDIEEQVKKPRR
jgi:hypothetical protein